MQNKSLWILGLASTVAVLSCGKKKSTSSQEVVDAINNALAIGYPDGLSIPTFPQTTSSSSLVGEDALNLEENDTKGKTLKQKREDAKAVLEGSVGDCFQNLKARKIIAYNQDAEKCYEFDQDMLYGPRNSGGATYGTQDGKSSSGEACMVSFARNEMKEIEGRIDSALDRAQVMVCLAGKEGKALPQAAGEELDLTQLLNDRKGTDGKAPTFDKVTLKRLDDKDGRPVFETVINTTKDNKTEELTIWHSPASTTDNQSYEGLIRFKRSKEPGNGAGNGEFYPVLSIQYGRSVEDGVKKVRASVRRGRLVAQNGFEPFNSAGLVNFEGVSGLDNDCDNCSSNDYLNGGKLVEYNMNESDSTGTMMYWQNPGGKYKESARGFVFKIEAGEGGLNKGCAISGATQDISVRRYFKDGGEIKPTRFWHPNPQAAWEAPNLGTTEPADLANKFKTDQGGPYVTRQCFKQNGEGLYVLDTDVISTPAGYELIKTDSDKFIQPPNLGSIKDKRLKN